MKVFFLASAFFFSFATLLAQNTSSDKEAAYLKTVTARAEKIVSSLQLTDAAKAARVTALVSNQYVSLNKVYTDRDDKLKEAKTAQTGKEAMAANVKAIEDETTPRIQRVHEAFIKQLSTELNEEQVTKIKDGLTYNVLPVTYKAFLEMIPTLKPAEKEQIMVWLVEARERAMDAESSEKKHGWFGKYKGRINNYLSAQGYDLQKERVAWQERIKAKEEEKKPAQAN